VLNVSARFCFAVLCAASAIVFCEDLSAPSTDRVGLPKDYQTAWKLLRTVEDKGSNTVKVVYANDAAASRKSGAYPYGAVIVMETWSTVQDSQKKALLDDAGHFRRDKVTGLHVMRKEPGFGEAYGQNRSGEWEFVEYRPDGSYLTAPAASAKCAACHLKAGTEKDFVYGGKPKPM